MARLIKMIMVQVQDNHYVPPWDINICLSQSVTLRRPPHLPSLPPPRLAAFTDRWSNSRFRFGQSIKRRNVSNKCE